MARLSTAVCIFCFSLAAACGGSGTGGGFEILAPADETAEAGKIVQEANADLKKIKLLYE
jgi:hypothetical protein